METHILQIQSVKDYILHNEEYVKSEQKITECYNHYCKWLKESFSAPFPPINQYRFRNEFRKGMSKKGNTLSITSEMIICDDCMLYRDDAAGSKIPDIPSMRVRMRRGQMHKPCACILKNWIEFGCP